MNQTLTKKTTGFQRVKRIILGSKKPNLLVRVSVLGGFLIWLFLSSWHLLTLLSLVLFRNLDKASRIGSNYQSIGYKYGYTDPINRLLFHSIFQLAIYFIILVGLILIWRRKKIGLLIYIIANVSTLLFALILMGTPYLSNEITLLDYCLIGITTLYFGLGFFLFYRDKSTNKQS